MNSNGATEEFKSGFAAVIGRPNVGKSTLVNRLVGQKVAIVTEKPQTTRNRIMGVVNGAGFQLVLLDTPGIHKPRHFLGRAMVKTAKRALHEVELIVFMVDGEYRPGGGDRYISRQLAGLETPVIMAVNKLDEVAPDQLQSRLEAYSELLDVEEQLAISALRGDNVPRLLQLLVDRLPEGPRYFPEDMVTDRPESFILAELVREQVLKLTREEVPHSVGVVVEELAERDNNMLYVNATILVERSSQKGILIGRGGRMLKDIGKRARNEIEALLGTRCYLDLWVKVSKDWRNREREVQRLGYGEQS